MTPEQKKKDNIEYIIFVVICILIFPIALCWSLMKDGCKNRKL